MTHGYSLRPKAKGRKSTDFPENVRSASANSPGRGNTAITDEPEGASAAADDGPANSHDLSTSLNPQTLRQIYGERRLEAWRQRGITTFSTTMTNGEPTTYRVEGPPQTLDDIQEGRRRAEARHRIDALRIQREQLEHQYRQDLSGLHDRIAVLRHECEEEIARVRWEWKRARAIERGESVEAEEEEEEEGEQEGEMDCDVEDKGTEVDSNCAPTEAWSTADTEYDDRRQRTRSLLHWSHSETAKAPPFGNEVPETPTPLGPPPLRRLRGSPLLLAGPSCPRRPSHGVQPLRRQPAQLMAVPLVSPHPGTTTSRWSDIDGSRTKQDQEIEMGHV